MKLPKGHNEQCRGCQICFEYLLMEKYGEEWWNHPDNVPSPEDLAMPVTDAFDLLLLEVKNYLGIDAGPTSRYLEQIHRADVEAAAHDLVQAMQRRDQEGKTDAQA